MVRVLEFVSGNADRHAHKEHTRLATPPHPPNALPRNTAASGMRCPTPNHFPPTQNVVRLQMYLKFNRFVKKGGPKPFCRPFVREGFEIQFREISYRLGNFSPATTPKCFANRFTEVGVGVKWLGVRRLGKMAARSDAARQTPPGRPGLQHTLIRPPSDAIPPRYCRFSALPPYSTTPRNGNRVNGNHLDQSLSSPQKNGN